MKLLIVAPYFYPKIGGLENYAYNFCIELKKKYKWDVIVVTSNHLNKKNIKEKLNGLTIYRLAPWFKFSNTPINPFWYFKVKEIIKKEKPDIINAHTPVPFFAEIAALVSGNTPFVLTYHALSLYKYGISPFNLIVWIYKLTENYLFNKSTKIIAVSEYIKDKLPDYLREKTIVINNSIKAHDIPKIISKKNKNNIALFVGSLDKTHNWKGLDVILLSIKKFINTYKININLVVIGNGDLLAQYKNLVKKLQIESYVKFVGSKIGNEKNEYFKKAKVSVIYPKTSNDALPTFLLESWGYRLPVIGSNIEPISKIIKNNLNGILVNPNAPQELASAMYKLFTNNKLRQKISKNGYSTLKKLYTFEDQLTKYNKLLNSI